MTFELPPESGEATAKDATEQTIAEAAQSAYSPDAQVSHPATPAGQAGDKNLPKVEIEININTCDGGSDSKPGIPAGKGELKESESRPGIPAGEGEAKESKPGIAAGKGELKLKPSDRSDGFVARQHGGGELHTRGLRRH